MWGADMGAWRPGRASIVLVHACELHAAQHYAWWSPWPGMLQLPASG